MLNRRAFLKSLGLMAGTVPLLSSLPARAQALPFPKRFVVFFTPNGTIPEAWFPTPGATETEFTLGPIHQPLAPFKDSLVFLSGVNMDSPTAGPGEPHQKGMGSVLTGDHLQQGNFIGGDGTLAGWGNNISVDQAIANVVGQQTRFASLQLGVRATGSEVRHRLSYQGPARPLPPENDPRAVWNRIFASFQQTPNQAEAQRTRRKKVLGAVNQQFRSLRDRISVEDRQKLDAHLALVRDMERRLVLEAPAIEACQVPAEPARLDAEHEDQMGIVSRLQADLLVMALTCDLTRVAVLQNSTGANNIRFTHLQSYTDDHQLSHSGPQDTTSQNEWIMRQRWYAGELAYLLGRLRSIPEGEGSMLDNTLLIWVSDLAVGNTHSHQNMPFVLAGKAGRQVRTGRYVRHQNRRHNDLWVSVLNAFDIPATTFGDPNFCSGALPGLI